MMFDGIYFTISVLRYTAIAFLRERFVRPIPYSKVSPVDCADKLIRKYTNESRIRKHILSAEMDSYNKIIFSESTDFQI